MGVEGSLKFNDETARELVKDTFNLVGHEMPEQSLEDRLRKKNQQI